MRTYVMSYSHSPTGEWGGSLPLNATDDDAAKVEVRAFVAQGYRNGTSASVDLQAGGTYMCWDEHGVVHAHTEHLKRT